MSWSVVQLANARATPWRNGGGITRELLTWPSATDWRIRISVADIGADGPFSQFPLVRRWFAVLEGQGVRLRFKQSTEEVRRLDNPVSFDGDESVDCELLDGPTCDLNLMYTTPHDGTLQRLPKVWSRLVLRRYLLGVWTSSTDARLKLGDEATFTLPSDALAWRITAEDVALSVEADDAHSILVSL